jgi:nucleoid DNA-binding protein
MQSARIHARTRSRTGAPRSRAKHDAEGPTEASGTTLDAILDQIGRALKNGKQVRLVGFGTFSMGKRAHGHAQGVASEKKIKIPVLGFKSGLRSLAKKGEMVRFIGIRTPRIRAGADDARLEFGSQNESKISSSAFEPDARARALLRGTRIVQENLRDAGGAYDLDEVRVLMRGISRQRVQRRVEEGSLLAVPGPSNRRRYPTVQFNHDGTVVEGFKEVRDALATRNAWSLLNFLVTPDSRLGGEKPIDLLKANKVEIVVEAARRIGLQGA